MTNLSNDKDQLQEIELLQPKLDEESILTSAQFIAHRQSIKNRKTFSLPKYCILGFFPKLYTYLRRRYKPEIVNFINYQYPYYIFQRNKIKLAFIFPGIGAPLSGMILDETISLGAEIILFFGTVGCLDATINPTELILPIKAVRDEGTSFHYQKPERYTWPDVKLLSAIEKSLNTQSIQYQKGMIWTTDGVYREVPSKIVRLRNEGCIGVDMEASALFSIANYYRKKIAGLFCISDYLNDNQWKRSETEGSRGLIQPFSFFEIVADVFDCYDTP